ncbi:MAG: pentapeptide repeat-containing protein [Nitrospirae bacterium]|nr:pentapeptide repeat-containing protein [Nitrospirota bacterium]
MREDAQAALLGRLVREWAEVVGQLPEGQRPALVLAGIRCGDIDLNKQVFPARIDCSGAKFMGDAWFGKAEFTGDALFRGATFTGSAEFGGATFTGSAEFGGATFTGGAEFGGATFTGDARFGGATFTGDARFGGATFTGDAWFRGATFTGDAWFRGATFTGDAEFDRAAFSGDALFRRTQFEGRLVAEAAWFLGRLVLEDNQFGFPAVFSGCHMHRLEYRTHKGERLFFNGCITVDRVDDHLVDAETRGTLDLAILENGARPTERQAGWLGFQGQHCEQITFQNMDLSRADFVRADVSKTRFISCRWNPPDKPRYPRLWGHPDKLPSQDREQNEQELLLFKNAYEQLKNNLEGHRDYVQAGAFHYWEMDLRQRLLRLSGKNGRKNSAERPEMALRQRLLRLLRLSGRWLERVLFGLYRLTADYGESYAKLFVTIAVTLGLATLGVHWREYLPWDGCGVWQTFHNTVFSLVPSAFQKDSSSALQHDASKWIVLGEGILLVVLVPMFVMAVRRRFRR